MIESQLWHFVIYIASLEAMGCRTISLYPTYYKIVELRAVAPVSSIIAAFCSVLLLFNSMVSDYKLSLLDGESIV